LNYSNKYEQIYVLIIDYLQIFGL